MSFGGYDKYTTSGFSWLGDIPEHWKLKRLRYVAECLDGRRVPLNSVERASMAGDIPYWGANSVMDCVNKCLFDEELVLLGEDGAPFFEPNKIVAFYSSGPVWPNNHIHVLRTVEELSAWFLVHVLNITDYSGFVNGSTRDKLTQSAMAEIPIPFPPISEQVAIASFLDQETSKIDALITEQQRLIELLKEKRQAVISHAVTKGLNPDVRMKPSDVEWLGEVPEHWKVLPLKRLVASPITDGPHETPQFYDEGVPFVSAEAVSSGRIDFSKIRGCISPEDNARYSLKYQPQLYDIYMVKSGATTGVTAMVEDRTDFNIWSPLAVVRCGVQVLPKFVLNVMRSRNFLDGVSLNWSFGTQQNIGMGVIENLHCPVPPESEQRAIISYLEDKLFGLGDLEAQAVAAIGLLQERRTALISAAVTGKIDVRNYASTQKDAA